MAIKDYSGFVAMLDILGFSDQVLGNHLDSDALSDYINAVRDGMGRGPLDLILFSDTVLIHTTGDNPSTAKEDFQLILEACSRIFSKLLRISIPVRGAIAYGPFKGNQGNDGRVIAGRPVVEAF